MLTALRNWFKRIPPLLMVTEIPSGLSATETRIESATNDPDHKHFITGIVEETSFWCNEAKMRMGITISAQVFPENEGWFVHTDLFCPACGKALYDHE